MLGSFLGQPALIFRGEDFAGDGRRGLHNQAAHIALEFGEHSGVVLFGGLSRLGNDLRGSGDGLLTFIRLDARSRGPSFFDQLVRLRSSGVLLQ